MADDDARLTISPRKGLRLTEVAAWPGFGGGGVPRPFEDTDGPAMAASASVLEGTREAMERHRSGADAAGAMAGPSGTAAVDAPATSRTGAPDAAAAATAPRAPTAAALAAALAAGLGVTPPPPGRAVATGAGALAAVGPLRWWIVDAAPRGVDPALGVAVDLSAAWVPLRLEGPGARDALARLIAVDLRERALPVGGFAATGDAHIPLKLWRRGAATWEVFAPRSFADDVLDRLRHAAALR